VRRGWCDDRPVALKCISGEKFRQSLLNLRFGDDESMHLGCATSSKSQHEAANLPTLDRKFDNHHPT
jgi:hypothetical protein